MHTDQARLRQLLDEPNHPGVVLLLGKARRKITAIVARQLCRSAEYEWRGKALVKAIRLRQRAPVWQRCYRNSEAPVLPPSPEYLNSLR